MYIINRSCFLILLIIVITSCNETNKEALNKTQNIDEFLVQLSQNKQFNGGVLIAQGGNILIKKSYGYSDFETPQKLTDSTVFQCASISKTFTAAAIFKLLQEDKLSLESKLTHYFPELPYHDVTIRHLLCHTSGLYPYNPLFTKNWDHSKIATNDDIIKMYSVEKPESFFTPGEEFAYSNVAYVFLASIVEQISGMPFDEYLKQNIFIPTKMMNTSVYTLLSEKRIEDFAEEHILDPLSSGQNVTPIESGYHSYVYYLNGKVGDDKVATTLDDLWKWNRALFKNNFLGEKNSRLAFSTTNEHIPDDKRHSKFDYGMGFQLDSVKTYGRVIYHNGGEPGLKVRFYFYPDMDLTLILYANAHVKYLNEIKRVILEIMDSQSYKIPKKSITDELVKVATLGKDTLHSLLNQLKSDTSNYYLSESEINDVAGIFWAREMYNIGFDFLQLNVELFPQSVSALYTMGEGYMETDQMEKAIPYFKEAKKLMLARPLEKQKPSFIKYMDQLISDYNNK